jgi:hypothetical protein
MMLHNERCNKMSMQFEKTTSGATPWAGGTKPAGVIGQDSGRSNAAPANGPAGGELRPGTMGPRTTLLSDTAGTSAGR